MGSTPDEVIVFFPFTSFQQPLGPGVYSATIRTEYRKYFDGMRSEAWPVREAESQLSLRCGWNPQRLPSASASAARYRDTSGR
jgi:hypothetical protein